MPALRSADAALRPPPVIAAYDAREGNQNVVGEKTRLQITHRGESDESLPGESATYSSGLPACFCSADCVMPWAGIGKAKNSARAGRRGKASPKKAVV
ncbi:MAG: hypothetical protein DI595_09855 [Agrobacterium fabrum]|uniref:Uncharacterized protein n=1 Tax=Agrobacterium fabrum TaxID=1176649 RepID=A0A2W5FBH6_9HYPH|nr:MAG: hypothetical protein DI595_09855 [Agrobacterium fabrum]